MALFLFYNLFKHKKFMKKKGNIMTSPSARRIFLIKFFFKLQQRNIFLTRWKHFIDRAGASWLGR